jgi:hypothetical protein
MKLWQRWKMTAIHNKALVLTSVLVAFGTLFYAAAAGFQVWLMVEGGKHTDEQIGRVIRNVNWMARSMDLSQKAAQQGIEASETQSQNALKATQDQMRLDERAWVVLRGAGPAPQLDQPWNLTVVFANTGKTPAKNVQWSCVNEFAQNDSSLKWWRLAYKNPTLLSPRRSKDVHTASFGRAKGHSTRFGCVEELPNPPLCIRVGCLS